LPHRLPFIQSAHLYIKMTRSKRVDILLVSIFE
jgi:hypothetical protein